MQSIIVSKAVIEDWEIIKRVGRDTFYETFAQYNSEKEMQKYLDENFSKEKLVKEIRNINSQFFIAWDRDTAIGYLKINVGAAQTELQDDASLEIERIYVKNAFQGKKVGQLLYDKAIQIAKDQNKKFVWLGVWEENIRAINFYKKNGFSEFDKHIFILGNEAQTDLMMKKILH